MELFKQDFSGKKFSEQMTVEAENPSDIINNNTTINNYGVLYKMYLELAAKLEDTEEQLLNPPAPSISSTVEHLKKR